MFVRPMLAGLTTLPPLPMQPPPALPPFAFGMWDVLGFCSCGDCGQLFDDVCTGLRLIVGMREDLDCCLDCSGKAAAIR